MKRVRLWRIRILLYLLPYALSPLSMLFISWKRQWKMTGRDKVKKVTAESNKAGEGTELNTAQKGSNIHTYNPSGWGQALGSAQAISKCTAHGTDCIHTRSVWTNYRCGRPQYQHYGIYFRHTRSHWISAATSTKLTYTHIWKLSFLHTKLPEGTESPEQIHNACMYVCNFSDALKIW